MSFSPASDSARLTAQKVLPSSGWAEQTRIGPALVGRQTGLPAPMPSRSWRLTIRNSSARRHRRASGRMKPALRASDSRSTAASAPVTGLAAKLRRGFGPRPGFSSRCRAPAGAGSALLERGPVRLRPGAMRRAPNRNRKAPPPARGASREWLRGLCLFISVPHATVLRCQNSTASSKAQAAPSAPAPPAEPDQPLPVRRPLSRGENLADRAEHRQPGRLGEPGLGREGGLDLAAARRPRRRRRRAPTNRIRVSSSGRLGVSRHGGLAGRIDDPELDRVGLAADVGAQPHLVAVLEQFVILLLQHVIIAVQPLLLGGHSGLRGLAACRTGPCRTGAAPCGVAAAFTWPSFSATIARSDT